VSLLQAAFAKVLADERRRAGMSQERLAFEADVHRTYISQLERGLKMPTLETLFAIAGALNLSPADFVRRVEERARHAQTNS
jgi:transcriptional regulator with XRE-family HTH domain